jgi:hypothetical protein
MFTVKSENQTFTRKTLGDALGVVKDQRIREALISGPNGFKVRTLALSKSNIQVLSA